MISKDNRDLGQRAATLSGAAILLKNLNFQGDASNVVPYLKITGTKDAAVLTALAGVFMTLYFILNVWAEYLKLQYEHEVDAEALDVNQAQPVSQTKGFRLFSNITFQPWVENAIAIIDFWLPLGLAVCASVLLWNDGIVFVGRILTRH